MKCEDAREARLDRASGPLDAERDRAFVEHVSRCEQCRAFTAELDAIEEGLEDTLGAAANVEVAKRFAPRAGWSRFGVAAALVVGLGLGALVAPSRRAEITVEVGPAAAPGKQEDPVKRTHGAVAATVVAVGVVSGAVLLNMDGQQTTVREGEKFTSQARPPISLATPTAETVEHAAAAKKIADLETALARSEARALELEKKLGAVSRGGRDQARQVRQEARRGRAAPRR